MQHHERNKQQKHDRMLFVLIYDNELVFTCIKFKQKPKTTTTEHENYI